jgi:hypothetical protein
VTTSDGASTDQVGLARSADSVLHDAGHHPPGPEHGRPPPHRDRGGPRAFWDGFRSTDSSDQQNETKHGTLAVRGHELGAAARLGPARPRAVPREQHCRDRTADGSTLQAFAGTLGTWMHAGLSPATPTHGYQATLGAYG